MEFKKTDLNDTLNGAKKRNPPMSPVYTKGGLRGISNCDT